MFKRARSAKKGQQLSKLVLNSQGQGSKALPGFSCCLREVRPALASHLPRFTSDLPHFTSYVGVFQTLDISRTGVGAWDSAVSGL